MQGFWIKIRCVRTEVFFPGRFQLRRKVVVVIIDNSARCDINNGRNGAALIIMRIAFSLAFPQGMNLQNRVNAVGIKGEEPITNNTGRTQGIDNPLGNHLIKT